MKFFIDRHGCAKNQIDAELIASLLEQKGWESADEPEDARLIIVNSCGFIEDAKKESLEAVITARAAYPHAKILLAGCLAQRYAADLAESLPEADGFFGNGDLSYLDEILARLFSGDCGSAAPVVVPPDNGVCCGARSQFFNFPGSAYIKVSEGCDNCCSFCAIPLIRGHLRSRPIAGIVAEIETLIGRGVKEFNLVGQDLASYGVDFDGDPAAVAAVPRGKPAVHTGGSKLAELLRAISALPGNFWIRLLYIHPDNFPEDLLPVIAADSRILHYFDIPFQSGADAVLRRMNRRGTATEYAGLVSALRTALPDAALRTTFLVGFPGESDRDFAETVSFVETVRPLWSGAFTYSREEDTPAALFKGRIPKKTAAARKAHLAEIQQTITETQLQSLKGMTVTVLVEEIIPGDELLALGRAWFQAPDVDGSVVLTYEENQQIEPGTFVRAQIYAVTGIDVAASVLPAQPVSG